MPIKVLFWPLVKGKICRVVHNALQRQATSPESWFAPVILTWRLPIIANDIDRRSTSRNLCQILMQILEQTCKKFIQEKRSQESMSDMQVSCTIFLIVYHGHEAQQL